MKRKRSFVLGGVLLAAIATPLVATGIAGVSPSPSATPIFMLKLKPNKEVDPPIPPPAGAIARGFVSFDLERDAEGTGADSDIDSGEAFFYFHYDFPAPVAISGLHVHMGDKKKNGDVVISSGVTLDCSNAAAVETATDKDGEGIVTAVVPVTAAADADPATLDVGVLQAMLDNPKSYYVNLHTCANPDGALRAQMKKPKKHFSF